ncbi:uncharacterized protein LOC134793137 [Cydia splendana]|uniref:uncharacterized protein LOC134793137 n=1 Tax=Cydia splendana TaxID=1100963 RepID=UPI00300C8BB1
MNNNLRARSIAEWSWGDGGDTTPGEARARTGKGQGGGSLRVWAARVGAILIKPPGAPASHSRALLANQVTTKSDKKCNMQIPSIRLWAFVVGCFTVQCGAYSAWPMYPQPSHEYQDDDYYYAPKAQYYYDNPTVNAPEVYGQVPYPYFYDPYGHFTNEAPKRQEERFAALPIGQETWFESDASPHWRPNDVDDVSAAFLDNLILTQMAQDAQRRRENARAAFPTVDYEERDVEDEDVRELKALAGKPLYHVPKTVPKIEEEDDYPNDEGFINWDGGNKRSVTTTAPVTTTTAKVGQAEIMVPRPANSYKHQSDENKRASAFYGRLAKLLQKEKDSMHTQSEDSAKLRKINKRFVAGDSDLVMELRGLKHRIPT